MPLVTLMLRKGKSPEFKTDAVHGSLVASGVPEKDRFHRVLELGPEDFGSTRPIPTGRRTGPRSSS
jgi:hypothetical protein